MFVDSLWGPGKCRTPALCPLPRIRLLRWQCHVGEGARGLKTCEKCCVGYFKGESEKRFGFCFCRYANSIGQVTPSLLLHLFLSQLIQLMGRAWIQRVTFRNCDRDTGKWQGPGPRLLGLFLMGCSCATWAWYIERLIKAC